MCTREYLSRVTSDIATELEHWAVSTQFEGMTPILVPRNRMNPPAGKNGGVQSCLTMIGFFDVSGMEHPTPLCTLRTLSG